MNVSTAEVEQDGEPDREVHDRSDTRLWPDVQVRGYVTPEFEILSRAKGGDGRTVYGIAVPYGKRQRIHAGLEEAFRMGAAAHQVKNPRSMKFAREHIRLGGALIGRATELREDTAGLVVHLRAAPTPAGDEALTLVEEGALDELSVGFHPVRDKVHPDGLVERVRANFLEVAVVLQGAYGRGARIQGVRSADGAEQDASDAPSGQDDQAPPGAPGAPGETDEGTSVELLRAVAARARSRIVIVRGMIR